MGFVRILRPKPFCVFPPYSERHLCSFLRLRECLSPPEAVQTPSASPPHSINRLLDVQAVCAVVRSRPWGHTVLRCRAGLLRGLDAGLSPGLISFVGTAVVRIIPESVFAFIKKKKSAGMKRLAPPQEGQSARLCPQPTFT